MTDQQRGLRTAFSDEAADIGGEQVDGVAPSPTYELSAGRASGPTRQVLYDQGGRLVGVVVTDTEHPQWCKAREMPQLTHWASELAPASVNA